MKTSELIQKLQKSLALDGDRTACIWSDSSDEREPLEGIAKSYDDDGKPGQLILCGVETIDGFYYEPEAE